jgi:hypothetical protein
VTTCAELGCEELLERPDLCGYCEKHCLLGRHDEFKAGLYDEIERLTENPE